eukprot:TRINITY_DN21056_c0_g2_i1.p1 TRINITY_DN21056_c0_g2~~TRINITY_DN21056_c0_g2_i1.p1  ORF type:complete len:377 (-),score=99.62 TRINITY_DN21056_c0_g2_i1:856-1986(-)
MDSWLARAKAFAEDAAKKSQAMALQTATYSEQLAKEAAKKSRELAEEAAKSADIGMKALVKEFSTSTTASPEKGHVSFTPDELVDYGITDDLREFVKGITIKTFKEFPLSEADSAATPEEASSSSSASNSNIASDLSPWQERHALLVLQTVEEMSDFRYVLCPRRMTERRFWRIYFLLVHTHVAPYEQKAKEKAAAALKQREEDRAAGKPQQAEGESLFGALLARTRQGLAAASLQRPAGAVAPADSTRESGEAAGSGPGGAISGAAAGSAERTKKEGDDLDAYLLGALETEGTAADDDVEEGDFDPDDFDKLVNNGEDSEASPSGQSEKAAGKQGDPPRESPPSSADAMSDGELVEPPSPPEDPQEQQQGGAAGH